MGTSISKECTTFIFSTEDTFLQKAGTNVPYYRAALPRTLTICSLLFKIFQTITHPLGVFHIMILIFGLKGFTNNNKQFLGHNLWDVHLIKPNVITE
jgi:hypothetical protein